MAKRIVATPPELTRLQRLTSDEDSVICNYRLLRVGCKELIAGIIKKVIADNASEAQASNVTSLRYFESDDDGAGEPTTLQRLIRRESNLMYAYRVMDAQTKEAMDCMFSLYMTDAEPRGENVVSIRR